MLSLGYLRCLLFHQLSEPLLTHFLATLARFVQRHIGLALAVYVAVLFTTTHYPKVVQPPSGGLPLDKVIHVLMYAGLALLLAEYARVRAGATRAVAAAVGVVGGVLLGVVDELTQPWFDRVYDNWDLAADGLGALLGAAAHWCAVRLRTGNGE